MTSRNLAVRLRTQASAEGDSRSDRKEASGSVVTMIEPEVAQNKRRIHLKLVTRDAKRDVSIEQVILALLAERGAGKTICPSEAARCAAELAGTPADWRSWMTRTRATAILMARRGAIALLQRGERVDPGGARGPIRLGLPVPHPRRLD